MTQLGKPVPPELKKMRARVTAQLRKKPVPPELKKMRARVTAQLRKKNVKVIDADSIVTGKDFLAIDYLRRAYLISGDVRHRSRAKVLLNAAELKGRARNSVEMLLARF
jgi:hypothetical protein